MLNLYKTAIRKSLVPEVVSFSRGFSETISGTANIQTYPKELLQMTYLLQPNKKSRKHIWNKKKNDTECRMWSTGGLKRNAGWKLSERTFDKETCHMCKQNIDS